MGAIIEPQPVLLIVAAFSRYESALKWGRDRAEAEWGAIAMESPAFDFDQTTYYEKSMGPALKKQFWAFAEPISPGRIAEIKRLTNRWEEEYAALGSHDEDRPLNLDPGYVGLGKLVLASTKDHAHRIYIAEGIFAEVTLRFKSNHWHPHDWTFADYRRIEYHDFFNRCREYLHGKIRERQ